MSSVIRSKRSRPYAWLEANYDELKPAIEAQTHPSWQALAELARSNGVAGPADGGPSRQTMYQSWKRLVAAKRAATKRPAASPAASIFPTFNPATDSPFPVEAVREDELDEFEFHDLKGQPL